MSEHETKDLQILEFLFYEEKEIGFSDILHETKIARSSLARHLIYLRKEGYISKVPDKNNRDFVYELTEEGSHEILKFLQKESGICFFLADKDLPSRELTIDELDEKDIEFLRRTLREKRKDLCKRAKRE